MWLNKASTIHKSCDQVSMPYYILIWIWPVDADINLTRKRSAVHSYTILPCFLSGQHFGMESVGELQSTLLEVVRETLFNLTFSLYAWGLLSNMQTASCIFFYNYDRRSIIVHYYTGPITIKPVYITFGAWSSNLVLLQSSAVASHNVCHMIIHGNSNAARYVLRNKLK